MEKVNITQKLALFDDYWHPRVVGELNGQQVKLVKFTGPSSGIIMKTKTNCF